MLNKYTYCLTNELGSILFLSDQKSIFNEFIDFKSGSLYSEILRATQCINFATSSEVQVVQTFKKIQRLRSRLASYKEISKFLGTDFSNQEYKLPLKNGWVVSVKKRI